MAEDTDQASKTEEPSAKRLSEARDKGDTPKSPDVAPLATLTAASVVCMMYGGDITRNIMFQLLPFIAHPDAIDLSGAGGQGVYLSVLKACAPVLAVLIAAGVAGAVGNVGQTGWIWAPGRIMPDLSKLNPLGGLGRIFSLDSLVNSGKSFLKLIAVGLIAWWILVPKIPLLQGMAGLGVAAILPVAMDVIRELLLAVLALMAVVAGADWFWQRYRFMQKLRMTKEEVKQEHKDADGDPLIKGKRRQLKFQKSRQRMMQAVPSATVVVMNPTHYAVALRYVQGETAAPECVAKGVDTLALRIRDLAREHGVPVVEDPPLARALYATVEVDQVIPTQHFEAVAKLIGFILAKARERARPARVARGL